MIKKVLQNKVGSLIISLIALFATTNTVLMMLVSSSRIMYGMSKDDALFESFSKIHDKTKTPWLATIVSALMSITVIIIFSNDISAVSKIAVFGIFTVFVFVNFSYILIKFKGQYSSFSSISHSFSILNYKRVPILAILGIIISVFMLSQFDLTTVSYSLMIMSILFLSGILFDKHKKIRKKY